jgi:hypothetical protein
LLPFLAYEYVLKTEALRSYETLVNLYQTTRRRIQEALLRVVLTIDGVWIGFIARIH